MATHVGDIPPPPSFGGEAKIGAADPNVAQRPAARALPAPTPASPGASVPAVAGASGGAGTTGPATAQSPGDEDAGVSPQADRLADLERTRSPQVAEVPRTFGRDLWSGFDTVIAHVDSDGPLLKDVSVYFKSIAEIERTFAAEISKASSAFLKRLSTKHSASNLAYSSLSGISAFTQAVMREAVAHNEFAAGVEAKLVKGFDELSNKVTTVAKAFGSDGRNLQREERDQLAAHVRARGNFHKVAEEHEQTEAQLAEARVTQAKDIEKIEKKHVRLGQTLEQAFDEYTNEVAATNQFLDRLYSTRMTAVLDALQMIHDEVRGTTKALLTAANSLSVGMLSQVQVQRDQLTANLALLDPARECQAFIQTNLPTTTGPETFHVIEHVEAADTTRRRRLERLPTPRGIKLSFTPTQVFSIPLYRALERQSTQTSMKVPRFMHQLFEWVISLGGAAAEGIFRLPGNKAHVESLRVALDEGVSTAPTSPHDAAALLKLWLKELGAPLVPTSLYDRAVAAAARDSIDELQEIVTLLPVINAAVLLELSRFLAVFQEPKVVAVTRMSPDNIATCFAPIMLKSPSTDMAACVLNLDNEIKLVRLVIQSYSFLDTRGLLTIA